jgi:hypothetical protein
VAVGSHLAVACRVSSPCGPATRAWKSYLAPREWLVPRAPVQATVMRPIGGSSGGAEVEPLMGWIIALHALQCAEREWRG